MIVMLCFKTNCEMFYKEMIQTGVRSVRKTLKGIKWEVLFSHKTKQN